MAESRYILARGGLARLPMRNRIGISVAADVYREIGRCIEAGGCAVRKRRTVVPLSRKLVRTLLTITRCLLLPTGQSPRANYAISKVPHE